MWWRHRPRWMRRLVLASLLSFFLLFAAGIGVVYAATKVPLPGAVNVAQTSVITYADGNHTIGTIGTVDRTSVSLSQVSVGAQHAVLAAEDRNFYHEPGISYRGIARALYTDVRGGGISQGGSTITQQYAKNAYLTQKRTFSRKIQEIALAVKLDKKYPKNTILEFYLNTIYFGRGAYGIEAASEAYFGIHASQLTPEQGAVIGGLIRSPNVLDPRVSPKAATTRWHEVIDTMVRQGWMSKSEAAAATMPVTKPKASDVGSGHVPVQSIYIEQAVKNELAQHGITESQISLGGLKIQTTLDYVRQTRAYLAVTNTLKQQMAAVPSLQTGLVAVQPGTGKILAWYGGARYDATDQKDNVTSALPPGSSFKPVVLATALSQGISLNSYYNAPDELPMPGEQPVHNDEKVGNFGKVTLTTATAESINTVYVPLAQDAGLQNMVTMSHKLGIPDTVNIPAIPRQSLGEKEVTAKDMVAVYGTFAAGGVEATPHLVDKVTDGRGNVIYSWNGTPTRVLTQPQDADLTYALQQVIDSPVGTAHGTANLMDGRPAAGKTGTVQGFRSAWFCGFVPQLASCVEMFKGAGSTQPGDALTGIPGAEQGVYGGSLPAMVWKSFMDAALTGEAVQQFPTPTFGGTIAPDHASPAPSPTPTPSASASAGAPIIGPLFATDPAETPQATPSPASDGGGGLLGPPN
jgi:membrane peptidoglycan carboxypeptidase